MRCEKITVCMIVVEGLMVKGGSIDVQLGVPFFLGFFIGQQAIASESHRIAAPAPLYRTVILISHC
jgi:hypothetical protein